MSHRREGREQQLRREVGPAAEGAWKLQGLGFSGVAWSKLLNLSELQRTEHRRKKLPCLQAELLPAVLWPQLEVAWLLWNRSR